jgi:SAM-dependent methyltransferase
MERYLPLFPRGGMVVEIGPGHGRWSELLIQQADLLVLCDLSPNCLDACRQRLAGCGHLRTHLSQAADLPADLTSAVDAVWSYDCLVHVGREECAQYLAEIGRVLRPGGVAVLHHADRRTGLAARIAKRLRQWWPRENGAAADHGWRSPVASADIRRWAEQAGLTVERQESMWTWHSPRGPRRIGVPRFGDCITVLRRQSVKDGRLPAEVMQVMREKERVPKAGPLVLNPSTERPTGD